MSDERGQRGLTTAEVAELLGVKRQTVYAYVSRGILHRQMALDGRTSLFDRAEVEQLRLGRNPERDGELRTMIATRLTRVSDDGVWIRGKDIIAAVANGEGFTEIADLLWDTPDDERWPAVGPPERDAEHYFEGLVDRGLGPLDQYRILLALESAGDPLRHDLSPRSVRAAGRRAVMAMATGLRTSGIPHPKPATTIGGLVWNRLTTKAPTPPRQRALDMALAVMADHGLAGSTFAARIAASVRADPYSVIAAGLGVLGGPLHGAASVGVHNLYRTAQDRGDAAAAVGDLLQRGERAPGFGHMVYRVQDPRYGLLMAQIVEGWADDERLQVVFRVRDVVAERSDAVPNVDLAVGALSYLADMPPNAGEAVFAIARTAGWLAHAMEEYEEKPVRFRPRARYIGAGSRS